MPAASRFILHIDMDAFFASVEELDHPQWRGRPVVVGADPKGGKGRGVVAACNYAARKFGVRSAMPISRAWRLCPQAVFAAPRGHRYAEISRRVFNLFSEYTDLVEPLSIDEAFLDVTGSAHLFGGPEALGREIKRRVREEVGLVASVGIAPNKFLAKIASDIEKPDGFVIVTSEDARPFLDPLPISRLWGVGQKTEEFLTRRGIRTIGDLARLSGDEAFALLGEQGFHLHQLARGIDERPVVPEYAAKSVGAEVTFDEDVADAETVKTALLALCDRVAGRLRAERFLAGGLTLKFRDEGFLTLTRSQTLVRPTAVTDALFRGALALLERTGWKEGGKRVRLVGIAAGRLTREAGNTRQMGLFDGATPDDGKRLQAERAVDAVRKKFGKGAVKRGATLKKPAG